MKLYRNAIILVVIVGLLTGAYFFLLNKKGPADPADNYESIKIFDLDTAEMVEMTLENKDGKFVFTRETVKEDDKEVKRWKITSPADLRVNESTVNSVAINFSSLIADKVIEENAGDMSKYGLEQPASVTVKMEDGMVKTLEIGDQTPTKSGYYAKEKGSSKVYLIGSYTGEKLLVDKNGLKDKVLLSMKPEDIIGFSMDRSGAQVFAARKSSDSEWTMTAPIEGNVNASAIGPMLEAVAQVSVQDFVEENPSDLGRYGLLNPAYSLQFETSTGKNRLLIGSEKEKGITAYAKLDGANEIFTVSVSPFNFLDKPLKEIVEVFAYIVNIGDVNKITVAMDGYTVNCELQTDKDDKDKDKFFVNGKEVTALKDDKDSQLFRKYYQALIGVTLSEVEPGAIPSGTPEITFTYYLKKDPGTVKVEFISKDDRYYYVMRNDKYTGILVDRRKFDEPEGVRDMYKKLTEAMSK